MPSLSFDNVVLLCLFLRLPACGKRQNTTKHPEASNGQIVIRCLLDLRPDTKPSPAMATAPAAGAEPDATGLPTPACFKQIKEMFALGINLFVGRK